MHLSEMKVWLQWNHTLQLPNINVDDLQALNLDKENNPSSNKIPPLHTEYSAK